MKVLKKALIFCAIWSLSAFLMLLLISIFGSEGADGKVAIGGWLLYFVIAVPTVLAITITTLSSKSKPPKEETGGSNFMIKDTKQIELSEDYDELFFPAVDVILETGQASVSMIQRRLKIDYSRAARILDEIEDAGIVSPFDGATPRMILLTRDEWKNAQFSTTQNFSGNSFHSPKFKKSNSLMFEIDTMEGHDFEYWCADVLRKNGFTDVKVTQGSGDQGVDVLAVKDGIKYAVQCKCYSSDLGNKPVQEVHTGKSIYHCQIGAVMTNRHFTQGAKDAAEATGVLLWDRDTVERMANTAGIL